MDNFSNFLRTSRKNLGLTQQDLAHKLNVSNKAVSKWETGECFPDPALLPLLSDILGCTIDELMRGKHKENPTEKIEREIIINTVPKKKPYKTLSLAALFTAAFGTIVFFLFLIAFDSPYQDKDVWATGILLFFISVSIILLFIALINFLITKEQ